MKENLANINEIPCSKKFIKSLEHIATPFYFYDIELLKATLNKVLELSSKHNVLVHYAVKANNEPKILKLISKLGFGADTVSISEVKTAIHNGFKHSKVLFAGVGKRDDEIIDALALEIGAFNVESFEEFVNINSIAKSLGKVAKVELRINPDVDPKTHEYISTGKSINKFGISYKELSQIIEIQASSLNIEIIGLHFHIGSQITDMEVFKTLCNKVNDIVKWIRGKGIKISHINLGGGLGIDYNEPLQNRFADFQSYFDIIGSTIIRDHGETLHSELGRSIVAQCGELVTKVLYTKYTDSNKRYVIVDAGMTDLIRPALYKAHHRIENITSQSLETDIYSVVGPICESSDEFLSGGTLPITKRGDILSIQSTGAYGRVMSSNYNNREITKSIYSDELSF